MDTVLVDRENNYVVKYYPQDGAVELVQWDGSDECTAFLMGWTGYRVREAHGVLLLQSPDLVE